MPSGHSTSTAGSYFTKSEFPSDLPSNKKPNTKVKKKKWAFYSLIAILFLSFFTALFLGLLFFLVAKEQKTLKMFDDHINSLIESLKNDFDISNKTFRIQNCTNHAKNWVTKSLYTIQDKARYREKVNEIVNNHRIQNHKIAQLFDGFEKNYVHEFKNLYRLFENFKIKSQDFVKRDDMIFKFNHLLVNLPEHLRRSYNVKANECVSYLYYEDLLYSQRLNMTMVNFLIRKTNKLTEIKNFRVDNNFTITESCSGKLNTIFKEKKKELFEIVDKLMSPFQLKHQGFVYFYIEGETKPSVLWPNLVCFPIRSTIKIIKIFKTNDTKLELKVTPYNCNL